MDLVVGRIGKPHGVRGEVTVDVRTDDPDTRFATGSSVRTSTVTRCLPSKVRTSKWSMSAWLRSVALHT